MHKPIQIGLIGGGMFGANHIESIRKDGRAEVRWVCDSHEPSLVMIQDQYEVVRGTTDYHKVLADEAVDAVIVVTPPFTHAEIATAVLRAGKHLLIEKPMAVNREEIETIIAEKKQHPELIALEGSGRHSRLQPKFDFVKSMVDSGKLGRVYHIHHNQLSPATFLDWNPKATWALDKKLAGGGPIFDWGEYDLSFHLGVLGDQPQLENVQAFHINDLRKSPGNVEQHAAAYLQFDNGLTYYYERGAGVHCEVGSETRIYGTEGGLKFSYLTWESPQIECYFEDRNGKAQKEILEADMRSHPENDNIPFVKHFIDCLEGKDMPRMPVELAAKHLDILLRILEA